MSEKKSLFEVIKENLVNGELPTDFSLPREEAGEGELGAVNSLHSRLSTFLAPFNGVSTRRLQRYLDWFCWEEQARRSPSTRGALLAPQVAGGSYSVRRAALIDEGQPFWDHWEGKHWCPEEELGWLEDVSILV